MYFFSISGSIQKIPSISKFAIHHYSYRSRYGRSIEDQSDVSDAILLASLNDAEDCAKKLVCLLNGQDKTSLEQDELVITDLFGKNEAIDVTSVTAEFDLAALMGRKAGVEQCNTIYARCPFQKAELMDVMRQRTPAFVNQI